MQRLDRPEAALDEIDTWQADCPGEEPSRRSMRRWMIVKCTVFLDDFSEWMSMNEVYVSFFSEGRVPARSAVAVEELGAHAKVEIECIAVRSKPAGSR